MTTLLVVSIDGLDQHYLVNSLLTVSTLRPIVTGGESANLALPDLRSTQVSK